MCSSDLSNSILIMVGVILDTLQQIESYLLMRSYDGMMKSGKVKGRSIYGCISNIENNDGKKSSKAC